MLISKINAYSAIAKNYQTKTNPSFKGVPNPQKCFATSNSDFFYKYGGYKGIITYNQIMSLKNLAEQSQKNGYIPNLAIAFFADPVMDKLVATSQEDLIKGNAKWTAVDDIDNA